jgi:hypothetical protein
MSHKQNIGVSPRVLLVAAATLTGVGLTMTAPSAIASPLSLTRAAVADPAASALLHEVVVVRRGAAVGPRGAVRRTTVVGPRGVARRTTVVGAGGVATRAVVRPGVGWVRPGHYWWRPGAAIAAGAAIGFVGAATAVAWAGQPPAPGYCWYYTDPSRTQGFWDACPQ